MTLELPLFPLDLVLFPGIELPLHIFEPRYRQMITECYEQELPFGIVLMKPESEPLHEQPYAIGTMAEIEALEHLEDGRINLIARGTQRFRILSQHRQRPYLSGIVEVYNDSAEASPEGEPVLAQVRSLFSNYLHMLLAVLGRDNIEFELPNDSEELSHFIAHLMDVQDEQKQSMLEMTSTRQRLEEEVSILRREVPFMREVLNMSRRHSADAPDLSILN